MAERKGNTTSTSNTSVGSSRTTAQKTAIHNQLRQTQDFISAQELHKQLQEQGIRIGLATVYRQLNALAASGHADTLRMGGEQLFRDCAERSPEHHHHLVCEQCGKTVDIEPPEEQWFTQVAQHHGFKVRTHVIEIFGICQECAQ